MSDNFLTRDAILSMVDTEISEETIPAEHGVWSGKKLFIKKLTRKQQDNYLRRQFGQIKMKQDTRQKSQEMTSANLYGHDTWLCVQAICDRDGVLLFKEADIAVLEEKSGDAIGYIAKRVLEFSKMTEDVNNLKSLEADTKNS